MSALFLNSRVFRQAPLWVYLMLLVLTLGSVNTVLAEPKESTAPASMGGFIDGVLAYRQGQYTKAEQIFRPLHEQAPDQSRITYYLALVKMQLSDFQAAKALFEEVTLLDPNSEVARLSHIALQQFSTVMSQKEDSSNATNGFQFDLPPNLTALSTPNASQPPTPNMNNNTNNMSPQDLMLMQMMMSGMGGNGNNNSSVNPMLLQGMLGQTMTGQGNGSQGTIDPNIMSTMMMNQMLQNFNMDFKGNNNNND